MRCCTLLYQRQTLDLVPWIFVLLVGQLTYLWVLVYLQLLCLRPMLPFTGPSVWRDLVLARQFMQRLRAILNVLSTLFLIGIGLIYLGSEPHLPAAALLPGESCSFGQGQVTFLAQAPEKGACACEKGFEEETPYSRRATSALLTPRFDAAETARHSTEGQGERLFSVGRLTEGGSSFWIPSQLVSALQAIAARSTAGLFKDPVAVAADRTAHQLAQSQANVLERLGKRLSGNAKAKQALRDAATAWMGKLGQHLAALTSRLQTVADRLDRDQGEAINELQEATANLEAGTNDQIAQAFSSMGPVWTRLQEDEVLRLAASLRAFAAVGSGPQAGFSANMGNMQTIFPSAPSSAAVAPCPQTGIQGYPSTPPHNYIDAAGNREFRRSYIWRSSCQEALESKGHQGAKAFQKPSPRTKSFGGAVAEDEHRLDTGAGWSPQRPRRGGVNPSLNGDCGADLDTSMVFDCAILRGQWCRAYWTATALRGSASGLSRDHNRQSRGSPGSQRGALEPHAGDDYVDRGHARYGAAAGWTQALPGSMQGNTTNPAFGSTGSCAFGLGSGIWPLRLRAVDNPGMAFPGRLADTRGSGTWAHTHQLELGGLANPGDIALSLSVAAYRLRAHGGGPVKTDVHDSVQCGVPFLGRWQLHVQLLGLYIGLLCHRIFCCLRVGLQGLKCGLRDPPSQLRGFTCLLHTVATLLWLLAVPFTRRLPLLLAACLLDCRRLDLAQHVADPTCVLASRGSWSKGSFPGPGYLELLHFARFPAWLRCLGQLQHMGRRPAANLSRACPHWAVPGPPGMCQDFRSAWPNLYWGTVQTLLLYLSCVDAQALHLSQSLCAASLSVLTSRVRGVQLYAHGFHEGRPVFSTGPVPTTEYETDMCEVIPLGRPGNIFLAPSRRPRRQVALFLGRSGGEADLEPCPIVFLADKRMHGACLHHRLLLAVGAGDQALTALRCIAPSQAYLRSNYCLCLPISGGTPCGSRSTFALSEAVSACCVVLVMIHAAGS